jgi:competence protein ComEC
MRQQSSYRAFFWEEAPFFRVLPPLIAAIVCYDREWLRGDLFLLFPAIGLCMVGFVLLARLRSLRLTIVWLRFLSLQMLVFFLGLLCCRVADVRQRPDWLGLHLDSAAVYTVRVAREPVVKPKTYRLLVELTGLLREGRWQPVSGKAFVYVLRGRDSVQYRTGDELLLPGGWQPVTNRGNPFEFDYQRYAARNGIHFRQFLRPEVIYRFHEGVPADEGIVSYVHNRCMQLLEHYVRDPGTLGILQAMILGDDVHLDPDLRQAYADTGIIHVVAISGGHVVMFFSMISALFFWLKQQRYQWLKYVIALPLVWFYVLVAGAPPSAVRAALMFSVLAFGISLRKDQHALNQLCATAFLLLCAEPMWLFSFGFQLSFIAVLSLILFYRPLYRLWPQTNRIAKALWEAACASLAAELLTAPLVVYYFHLFPLMFLPANIIAWLLMGVVLVLGIFLLLFAWWPLAAGCIATVLTFLVQWFHVLIFQLQGWNPEPFRYLVLSLPTLVALYLVIGCLAIFFLKKNRPALTAGMVALCLMFGLLCMEEWKALRQHRLVVYPSGNTARIERIAGKYYQELVAGDTSAPGLINTVSAARTGWHAWKMDPKNDERAAKAAEDYGGEAGRKDFLPGVAGQRVVFEVNGKQLVYVRRPLAFFTAPPFQVHTLLADMPLLRLSFEEIYQMLRPEAIVVAGNQPATVLSRWRDSCRAHRLHFHVLKTDGVYVLE